MKHLFNKKMVLFYVLMCLQLLSIAQTTGNTEAPVEMADGLYQSGKIYVVILVIAIIFAGILTYLILLDRKISKLEKEFKVK
jgi:CcmD family protein